MTVRIKDDDLIAESIRYIDSLLAINSNTTRFNKLTLEVSSSSKLEHKNPLWVKLLNSTVIPIRYIHATLSVERQVTGLIKIT